VAFLSDMVSPIFGLALEDDDVMQFHEHRHTEHSAFQMS